MFGSQKLDYILLLIEDLIQIAEEEFSEPGSGAEKRKYVIDEINEKVDVPILFSEEKEGEYIGMLVDFTVGLYNKGRLFIAQLAADTAEEVVELVTGKILDITRGE